MITAGRVGSTPNSAAIKKQSRPLKNCLSSIGKAVFYLNTIVVGLDAVEKGHQKPLTLDISWTPHDCVTAARQTRKFAVESVLIRASESVYQYIHEISRYSRFKSICAKFDSNTSKAVKCGEIARDVIGNTYLVGAVSLLIHWRNRVVHENSKAKLNSCEINVLNSSKDYILNRYKSLDIDTLLCHFDSGKPSLKDVSSLIMMAIVCVKRIDCVMFIEADKDSLDCWLNDLNMWQVINKVRLETKAEKLVESLHRAFQHNAAHLWELYKEYYLNDCL